MLPNLVAVGLVRQEHRDSVIPLQEHYDAGFFDAGQIDDGLGLFELS